MKKRIERSDAKNRYTEGMRRMLMLRLDELAEPDDRQILAAIDELVLEKGREDMLSLREKEELRKDLFFSVRKLDVIQDLVDDPDVTEIMVNGPDTVFYEKAGRIYRFRKSFVNEERLMDIIQQIAGKCNRVVNEQNPIADARLENGDRVNIVLPPVSLSGPILTIRRFPKNPMTMEMMIKSGSITAEAAGFLKQLVKAGYSIMVGGGTSTGKTTFLNALSAYIPSSERIVTIEDNAELQIRGISNLVRLEAKSANLEENREITIRDLIKTALRMRPNRIIIGEIRGMEAADFLTCLNTGHSGSLGTAHANSTRDMIGRIESMVRMGQDLPVPVIRDQIASGIEILVQLTRDALGRRKVEEISEICGIEDSKIIIRTIFGRDKGGPLVKTGELTHTGKLELRKEIEREHADGI